MEQIVLKRVYEPVDELDGSRVLVDRMWPRGISKEKAGLSLWLKEAAPSPELRKWFCHKPELFEEFSVRYLDELRTSEQQAQAVEQILALAAKGRVTILYGAKDPMYNHARVLMEELENRLNN